MRIDPNSLSTWAQKQILEKIREQNADRAKYAEQKKKSKYNNVPDTRGNLKFDSKKEANRFDDLLFMLEAGEIRDLRLQQEFTLQEAYTTPEGERVRAIRYKADFVYEKKVIHRYQSDGGCDFEEVCEWERVIEDVKSKATKTRTYAIKKKLMLEKFGKITEVE